MVSGGAKRITVSCVSLVSTPRRASRSTTARALTCCGSRSTPTHSPRPRTARISGTVCSSCRRRRRASKWAPSVALRAISCSSSITRSASRPTAAASGLPPKVEPWLPGSNKSITSAVPMKQLTGSKPPPSALPRMSPSGRTPSCWNANQRPVRPRPDWTSSRISSTRRSSHRRRAAARKPGAGTTIPASPWIGSSSTAAVRSVIAAASESMSPKSKWPNPGAKGPKSAR